MTSLMSLVLCFVMLLGVTFAWFTDSASTAVNKIKAGTLDVGLEMKDAEGNWVNAEGRTLSWVKADGASPEEAVLWEPGCTYRLPELRIINKGNLYLKYKMLITGIVGDAQLLGALEFTYGDGIDITAAVTLEPHAATEGIIIQGKMKTDVGNEYKNLSIDGIGITVYATQYTAEFDSFGKDYDQNSRYPVIHVSATGTVADGAAATVITDEDTGTTATIPANTLTTNDVVKLVINRTTETKFMKAYDIDIKVNGGAPAEPLANPVVVTLNIGTGLNDVVVTHNGNYMTKVDNAANDQEYSYYSTTGVLTIVTKSFSPFEISYTAAEGVYLISSADDLAYFAKSVISGNTYAGKTVKLTQDIDLAGRNWLPIGMIGHKIGSNTWYYAPFCGTFDGDGHSVINMKTCDMWDAGNYQYFNGAALFGCTGDGAVIKNLTVKKAIVWGIAGNGGAGQAYASAVVGNHWQGSLTFEKVSVEDSGIYAGRHVGCLLGIAGREESNPATVTFTECSMKNITEVYVNSNYSDSNVIGTVGAYHPTIIGENTVVQNNVIVMKDRDEFYRIRDVYFPDLAQLHSKMNPV